MALTVGGTPITAEQLATLQADLGIVVAEEITARLTSLQSTDDAIFLRSGTPNLVSAAVIAAYTGSGSGTQTLTATRFDNGQTFYGPTVAGGSASLQPARYDDADTFYAPTVTRGAVTLTAARFDNAQSFYAPTVAEPSSGPAYLSESLTLASSGSVVATRPAGADSSHTLIAVAVAGFEGQPSGVQSMSPPSGWTSLGSDFMLNNTGGMQVFSAAGDVSALTFTATGITSVTIVAFTGSVRELVMDARYWGGGGPEFDHTNPAVTAGAGDLVIAIAKQVEGTPDPAGSPPSGYTREFLNDASLPRCSVLSQHDMSAGITGTIAQNAGLMNYSSRYFVTIAVQA